MRSVCVVIKNDFKKYSEGTFVTSSVKAEGDQPAEPRWECAIYLFEDVTLMKQNHTHRLDHTEYVKQGSSWVIIHSEPLKQI